MVQSDIRQFIGMAKEVNDFRADYGEEPYWTNSSFVGMPTYQLSAYFPGDWIKKVDEALRFLPRPADYLFLYFLGFFLLLRSFRLEYKLSMLGALVFGFSTYLIIIIGVGHNAKAHAIAYMPFVLAGLIQISSKNYIKGFLLTAIGMALELKAGHLQMTYYLLFVVLAFGLAWLIRTLKEKGSLKVFLGELSMMVFAVVIALGMNASHLLATAEYADFSTRGQSELSINPDGSPKQKIESGLSKSYITEYSYGLFESFDLIYARLQGGGNAEPLGESSVTQNYLAPKIGRAEARRFSENAPLYWGDQPIVAAPAYIGGSVFFLFFVAIFLVTDKSRNWILGVSILALMLSWGKNLPFLTDFFIDYIPLYNKFRAVSSIQVILELMIPLFAFLGLKQLFSQSLDIEIKKSALKKGIYISLGLGLGLLMVGFGLDYQGQNDSYYDSMLPGLAESLQLDRARVYKIDIFKSMLYALMIFAMIWLYLRSKLKYVYALIGIGLVCVFDLVQVDRRYVNEKDFVPAIKVDKPYTASSADQTILQDDSYYRVANLGLNFINDGSTSYFHHSLGGYHAAKPRRFQEVYDFYLSKNKLEVYNLLNVKYFIIPDENGTNQVQLNAEANGNAWYVDEIKGLDSADDEIISLGQIDTKKSAIIKDQDLNALNFAQNLEKDTLAAVDLVSYKSNELSYRSKSDKDGFVVFSEAYYQPGWQAYIDNAKVEHYRVDYLLRGLEVPKGEHEIRFEFVPKVIHKGQWLNYSAWALLIIGIAALSYRRYKFELNR